MKAKLVIDQSWTMARIEDEYTWSLCLAKDVSISKDHKYVTAGLAKRAALIWAHRLGLTITKVENQ